MIYSNTFHNFVRRGGAQQNTSGKSSATAADERGAMPSQLDHADTLLSPTLHDRKFSFQVQSEEVKQSAHLEDD